MTRNVLIHTRNLSIPGGKQTYILAVQKYFKNHVSYFYYGTQVPVKESRLGFIKRFFKDYIDFYRLLKKGRFDLVHINTSFNLKSYFRDSIFTLISKMLKLKTVVFWHGWRWDFEKKYGNRIVPYFRFTFGKADSMVCLANEFADRLYEYGYKKPIFTETTVVEDEILNYDQEVADTEHKNGGKKILFLSRVEIPKGIYETIDSFKNLKTKFSQIVLTVAGTGSELDNVKAYVADKNIEDVRFLGWIEGEEKIEALSKTDIFVLASYTEGMPICVLEAMAFGKPIVTTDVGAIKDFFEDGKMGLTVQVKNSNDLEEKIEKLLADTELAKRIGHYNSVYAKERFSAKLVSSRLENIYEQTILG